MSSEVVLQLLQVISLYCSLQGPGQGIELTKYGIWGGDRERSAQCFTKVFTCAHNLKEASAMPFEVNNCISKHVKGELK